MRLHFNQDMKRHISVPVIAALAAVLMAGWGGVFAAPVLAQQQGAPAAESSGSALDERILRLEERIQDLQSVIGTLQSFIRDGGGTRAPGALPPQDGQGASAGAEGSEVSIRVLALETQINALTGQMGQIAARLNQMESQPGLQPESQSGALFSPAQRGEAEAAAPAQAPQAGTAAPAPLSTMPFAREATQPRASQQLAAPPGGGEGPQATYDASYQNYLRNDFAASENGFRSFIATYANDPLIANAYYWLGRTHFERRQFKPAAEAFMAGYKKDNESVIAPDALLHLGLSLAQLGEKEAACSTLDVVSKQFPDAADSVKQETADAIQRVRC